MSGNARVHFVFPEYPGSSGQKQVAARQRGERSGKLSAGALPMRISRSLFGRLSRPLLAQSRASLS